MKRVGAGALLLMNEAEHVTKFMHCLAIVVISLSKENEEEMTDGAEGPE